MRRKEKNKINADIDKNIRKAFGKFYIFSIVCIILLLLFPFIINRVKIWFSALLLLFFLVFFIVMISELFRKKDKYWSSITSVLVFIFIVILTLDVIKFVFFLIKWGIMCYNHYAMRRCTYENI